MNKNQKGFSAVESLLILIIVGIIGGVGYFVYSSQKNTNKALDNATKANSSTVAPKKAAQKNPQDQQNLVVNEWGLKFKIPSGLSDVKYVIHGDTAAFFATPRGANVQYRADYDKFADGHFQYATGQLYRSTQSTNNDRGDTVQGKKIGNYYYYTSWAFNSLATGAACVGLYGDGSASNCQLEGDAFGLVNHGDNALLNTIELAQ